MSILIKGMKMPKGCKTCGFVVCDDEHSPEYWCPIVCDGVDNYVHCRHKFCPLIEIPPHGRLIDADKFMKPFYDLLEKDEHSLDYYSVSYGGLNAMIDNAPTVIESEEQEHE